ncbi:MAG: hypothetical protein ACOYLS_01490 [Polymorphobacter sp.]
MTSCAEILQEIMTERRFFAQLAIPFDELIVHLTNDELTAFMREQRVDHGPHSDGLPKTIFGFPFTIVEERAGAFLTLRPGSRLTVKRTAD